MNAAQKTMLTRAFTALSGAFPPAMLIAAALFRVTRLEMMINMGWVFFALWALFALGLFFVVKKISVVPATLNIVLCGAVLLFLLGPGRVASVPAAIIREGIGAGKLPFSYVNAAVSTLLTVGWLTALWTSKTHKKRECKTQGGQ